MGILDKTYKVFDSWLDDRLQKAQATNTTAEAAYDRRGLVEVEYGQEQQWGWKEKRGLLGPAVLKNMARKNSVVAAILQTRMNQVARFAQPQKDKYSPGFKILPKEPADLSRSEKLSLGDPNLSEEEMEIKKFELEQKRSREQEQQDADIKKIADFVIHCGINSDEQDTTYKRCDFEKCVRLWTWDRLVYNYTATEFIPTKTRDQLHHWYPVSAGTVRYVSRKSGKMQKKSIQEFLNDKFRNDKTDSKDGIQVDPYNKETPDPFRYVQVIRGRIEAAWTEQEFLYEAANPSVDPEDNGYAPGELEGLIHIITAHMYAEAHNRNYFTQGIGTKGILHIKGENISRAQLEGFKRQWFNQLASSRNAFRPPIIGMADDVKWVELAQSNKDMEFDNWMHYLIRMMCAVFQMDPAEINFDISKINTSTLNETSNEERLKSSRDKGLQPLLDYVENLLNRHILPKWDKDLAAKYEFKFVGMDAETRKQESERLKEETQVWKTVNEARIEQGKAPIADGDIILAAAYTQYLQMKEQAEQMEQGMMDQGAQDEDMVDESMDQDNKEFESRLDEVAKEAEQEVAEEEKAAEDKKKEAAKKKEVKKSNPTIIEYYQGDDE